MAHAFFITGTDTDAGKTTVAAALLQAARAQGLSTLAIKPVASGCERTAQGLRNSDALALAHASSIQLPYAQINPYVFAPAIAPHLAAQQAGVQLNAAQLAAACHSVLQQHADLCLIEGAGGWRVPISSTETLADLAKTLQLPVILVVGMRLGCINHALLTAEAIQHDGLKLAGWIANSITPDYSQSDETIACLRARLNAPCLATLPYATKSPIASSAQALSAALPSLLS